jgi:hypothetical protein
MEKRIDEIFSKMRKCKNKQLILVLKELIDLSKKARYEKLILKYLENDKNLKTFGKCIEKCKIMHGGEGEGEGEGEGDNNESCSACPICLVDFAEDNETATPCDNNHLYHKECIYRWIAKQICEKQEVPKPSCPLCRQPLKPYYLQINNILKFEPPISNETDTYTMTTSRTRKFTIHTDFAIECRKISEGLENALIILRDAHRSMQTSADQIADSAIRARALIQANADELAHKMNKALRELKIEVGTHLLMGAGSFLSFYETSKLLADSAKYKSAAKIAQVFAYLTPAACAVLPSTTAVKYVYFRRQYKQLHSEIINDTIDNATGSESLTSRISSLLPRFISRVTQEATAPEAAEATAAEENRFRLAFFNGTRVAPQ